MTMTQSTDEKTHVSKTEQSHQDTPGGDDGEKIDTETGQSDMSAAATTDETDSRQTTGAIEKSQLEDDTTATEDTLTLSDTTTSTNREASPEPIARSNIPMDDSLKTDLSSRDKISMEAESAENLTTNKKQYGELDNYLQTNDSPIHAVNQLTGVNSYTVEWKPATSLSLNTTTAGSTAPHRDLAAMVHSATVTTRAEEIFPRQGSVRNSTAKTEVAATTPPSVLELTVDKLKSSKTNGALGIGSYGTETDATAPSKVLLASSGPPDFLNEIKERAQLNRRKNTFVAKSSPLPIFRGLNRRSRQIPRQENNSNNMPAFGQFVLSQVAVSSASLPYANGVMNGGGLEMASQIDASNQRQETRSSNNPYVINRAPLRKIAPKSNDVTPGQPLVVSTGPTTPPTPTTFTAQDLSNNNLVSPLGRQVGSPNGLLTIDETKRDNPIKDIGESQQQPLDLCTKSSSEASSQPSSPSLEIHDENQPLNLSKSKSPSTLPSPSVNRKLHQLPPMSGNMPRMWSWKTPPRGMFLGHQKPSAGTSSPLEGDTASDTAANSPGLDNQKLPYGLIMSPEQIMNGLVPMGALSPTGQMVPQGLPEGAILLPGPGPHYRLSPHMAKQHSEPPTSERPYMCDFCGATFKRNKSLKQHYRVHANEKPNFQFGDNSQQDDATKSLLCDQCPRKFAHPEQLKRHIRAHREDKPFICDNEHCGKRFLDSSQLKLHMRTHSSHKPFPCPYCPLRFKYSGDVKRHVRIHTGEKPYVCGYCKMRFTQSNTLKQHERTHTGERPYHCHKCGMTFTQSGSLKYHLAHRHPPDVQTIVITTTAPTMPSAVSPTGSQMMMLSPQMSPQMTQILRCTNRAQQDSRHGN